MTANLPHLIRKAAASHGYGVFINQPIGRGSHVLTMSGQRVPASAVTADMRAMQVDNDVYLVEDISPSGQVKPCPQSPQTHRDTFKIPAIGTLQS